MISRLALSSLEGRRGVKVLCAAYIDEIKCFIIFEAY